MRILRFIVGVVNIIFCVHDILLGLSASINENDGAECFARFVESMFYVVVAYLIMGPR